MPSRNPRGHSWLRDAAIALVVGIIAAVAVGGTAPWWWDGAFGDGDGTDEVTTTTGADPGGTAASSVSTTASSVSTTASTGQPPQGCRVQISNPFASIRESPRPTSQEIVRVPAGEYEVLDIAITSFAGTDQRWFQIDVPPRTGWIQDTTIFVSGKTAGCP